jgi:predicted ATPase
MSVAPIENPPLPRPKPSLLDATGDNLAVLISAFRHQHGALVLMAAFAGALAPIPCLSEDSSQLPTNRRSMHSVSYFEG